MSGGGGDAPPFLIALSGLPGTGKTTLARALAARIGAVHLRIDGIEAALATASPALDPPGDAGYVVAYAIAEDSLRLGRTVIADCVNPLDLTRAAWRGVAGRAGCAVAEVEIVCSDIAEHEARVERRRAEGRDPRLPSWHDVVARDYRPWRGDRHVVDTAGRSVEDTLRDLLPLLSPPTAT